MPLNNESVTRAVYPAWPQLKSRPKHHRVLERSRRRKLRKVKSHDGIFQACADLGIVQGSPGHVHASGAPLGPNPYHQFHASLEGPGVFSVQARLVTTLQRGLPPDKQFSDLDFLLGGHPINGDRHVRGTNDPRQDGLGVSLTGTAAQKAISASAIPPNDIKLSRDPHTAADGSAPGGTTGAA